MQRSHPALAMPRMTSSDSGASASASGQLLGDWDLDFSAGAVATSVGGALHRALAKKRWKAKYSPNTGGAGGDPRESEPFQALVSQEMIKRCRILFQIIPYLFCSVKQATVPNYPNFTPEDPSLRLDGTWNWENLRHL